MIKSALKTFARVRLNMLLKSQAIGAFGALVWCVADMVVAGNIIGVDALAGIAATVPVTIGAQFFARMVYCGSGYLFAKRQGEFDQEGAKRAVGISIEMALIVGAITFAAMFFGRDVYLDAMGIEGAVRVQAVAYWRWMTVFCALNPFTMTMWRLVYADGEMMTTAIGDLMAPPLTVVLSIVFTKLDGTAAGAAMGTLVAGIISDSTMMSHVFRKNNSIIPKWNFSFDAVRQLVGYSLTDASIKLCQCGFMAVVNKMVVVTASVAYLPVVSLIALVLELRALLDRIGDAYMPIAKMYLGEHNLPRVRELSHYSLLVSFIAGIGFMVVIMIFAPQIVGVYGIPRGEVFDHGVTALRICSAALPISSVLSFMCSHYLIIDRVSLSVVETVMAEFLLTAACAVGLSLVWGLDALWVGLPAGGVLSMLFTFVYGWWFERGNFPMLIPESRHEVLNLSFQPSEDRIVAVRNESEAFLSRLGIDRKTIARIMLLVEECSMSVVDLNGKKSSKVLVEVSFVVDGESVRMVLRDTGDSRDITDSDAKVAGLRSFVIAGLMQSYEDRRYLNTIGCNRAAFVFDGPDKQRGQEEKKQ